MSDEITYNMHAAVAELADAQDLKSCGGDIVPVRFRSAALTLSASNPYRIRAWGISFFEKMYVHAWFEKLDDSIVDIADTMKVVEDLRAKAVIAGENH